MIQDLTLDTPQGVVWAIIGAHARARGKAQVRMREHGKSAGAHAQLQDQS